MGLDFTSGSGYEDLMDHTPCYIMSLADLHHLIFMFFVSGTKKPGSYYFSERLT